MSTAGEQVQSCSPRTVGELERALLGRFPAKDAEEWDRTGLLVGDPEAALGKVAIALDATVPALRAAHKAGAGVLLTHHPAFLAAPDDFLPGESAALHRGAVVYEALHLGLALMNFHTALDVSREAQAMLPGLLSLHFERVLMPLLSDSSKGYGQLCVGGALTLAQLAHRAKDVFGRPARVWGHSEKELHRVVTCTGAVGDVGRASLAAGADCLVCGEIKYHEALDLSLAGLAIIELGHDVSELPFCDVLARALADCGVPSRDMELLSLPPNWESA